jgi:DNA-binding NtrC family response regulator
MSWLVGDRTGGNRLLALPAPIHPAAARAVSSTVLVVAGDVGIRTAEVEYLRRRGYNVAAANGLAAAMMFLESDTPVDIMLSETEFNGAPDGITLAQWVRRHRSGIDVLLTGMPARMARQALMLCDFAEIVPRPYDLASLERRIRELVRQRLREPAPMIY